jgi:hypothetical protein
MKLDRWQHKHACELVHFGLASVSTVMATRETNVIDTNAQTWQTNLFNLFIGYVLTKIQAMFKQNFNEQFKNTGEAS